ncbi:MAG: zinc-ribbon domain-containing protein [Pyrinomonadaceae bacterium]|nr:zinc-ribbon domain-containing protein [Pyrinomonadaceae bacterium]
MIVICSSCSTRLQLDEAKLPSRPFTIRCPKCQNIINGQPPAAAGGPTDQSALAVGSAPALDNVRYKQPKAAPAFKLESLEEDEGIDKLAHPKASGENDLARLLTDLLQRGGVSADHAESRGGGKLLSWGRERRRALVCLSAARRETVARLLAEDDYEVFVAEDTAQAIESMREEQLNVVILEADFDPIEQGAAFVTREVNALRPAQRRRLLFVHLTPTARTMDTHAAFVSNVNLVVNLADLEHLPHALERAARDFKELYRDLNTALNVASY